jgi:hypothetical protein
MTFDVDAWLEQAQPPQRSVTVYGRGDLVAELQDLYAQDEDLPGDARLGGSPLNARILELQDLIEASALIVHVRGILDHENRALVDQHTTGEGTDRAFDAVAYERHMLAAVAVQPQLTPEQAGRLRERIGQAQWDALFAAMSAAAQETIDVPLSRLGSATAPDS